MKDLLIALNDLKATKLKSQKIDLSKVEEFSRTLSILVNNGQTADGYVADGITEINKGYFTYSDNVKMGEELIEEIEKTQDALQDLLGEDSPELFDLKLKVREEIEHFNSMIERIDQVTNLIG